MESRRQYIVKGNSQFSQKIRTLVHNKKVGELKLPFPMNSGFFKGTDLYAFLPIDGVGSSFRVFKSGKSVGYLHIHAYRNLAQVNLVEEGPYQFSLDGILNGNWVIRQGKKSIEKSGNQLSTYFLEGNEIELVMACGLFIAAKAKADILLLTLGIGLFLLLIFLFW
jgi:hypothetical protein